MTSSTLRTDRVPVAVIGLGPMGRALAGAFAAAGHPVTVWNRTPGKAGEALRRGAAQAGTIEEAISSAAVVVICVKDYEAALGILGTSRAVWDGRVLVNLTSGTPAQARQMTDWARARGLAYLDGAILTPVPAIGTPAARVICSGPQHVYHQVTDTLAAIGTAPVYLDGQPGTANGYDLALLDIFHTAVHGITHALALVTAEGIPARQFAPFAAGIGAMLSEMIPRFAGQVDAGSHPGDRSTIGSAQSSIRHVTEAAERHGIGTGALAAAQAAVDRAVADGHGDDGLSYLAVSLRRTTR
jgi:3-hydroxyisobutyrate dehydrogenase-like beta-hydroxyacid dehydrogenase